MTDINDAFHKLSNDNNNFRTIEYFFTQRKINEEQEFLDKSLNRKNKTVSVVYNFLAVNIPNILVDEMITGFDVEIFGDMGYHYKAFISNYQGIVPHFLIPLKGDKKMFVNIVPKIEKTKDGFKYDPEALNISKNYVAFIEVPKRYQAIDHNLSNQLQLEDDDETSSQKE